MASDPVFELYLLFLKLAYARGSTMSLCFFSQWVSADVRLALQLHILETFDTHRTSAFTSPPAAEALLV